MNDELEPLRRIRPDRLQDDEPNDPWVLADERDRLMSIIEETDDAPTARHVPAMYPRLAYDDERAALEYLQRVFGFRERREARMGGDSTDEHILAWLELGDGVVMIGVSETEVHQIVSPRRIGGNSVMINVAVDDIDAHYEHAVAEGAEIVMAINDAFYGFRRYEAFDLEGHRWHFHEALASVERRRAGR